jgi:TPR repeat protein
MVSRRFVTTAYELKYDEALAMLEKSCDESQLEGCTQLALLLAARNRSADTARARELLNKSCDAKFSPACDLLKSFPKPPRP